MTTPDLHTLAALARRVRRLSIQATTRAGSGHPTSCLSAADLMAALFFTQLRYDFQQPHRLDNDRFVLSKGHAAPVLYAPWAAAGAVTPAQIETLRELTSDFEGHPTPRLPFVDVATGSLGQGLPNGVGMALYLRPTMIATEGFLGVRPANTYKYFIIASPVGSYYGAAGLAPVRIWVEEKYVRAARGGLGAVKAGANYAASLLAAEEAKKRGYAQVLWLDASNHRQIEEVGTMNLFLRIGDTLVTPPLGGTILAGVTRETVITLARGWGLDVEEREINMEEVISAYNRGHLQELFGCGTAAVIAPVGELGWGGERLIINGGKPGELSQRLYDTITGVQYGRLPDPYDWLSEVPRL